jgi:hypothetical protein
MLPESRTVGWGRHLDAGGVGRRETVKKIASVEEREAWPWWLWVLMVVVLPVTVAFLTAQFLG